MTWQRGFVITELACPSEIEKTGAQLTLSGTPGSECNGQRPGGPFKMSGMKAVRRAGPSPLRASGRTRWSPVYSAGTPVIRGRLGLSSLSAELATSLFSRLPREAPFL